MADTKYKKKSVLRFCTCVRYKDMRQRAISWISVEY